MTDEFTMKALEENYKRLVSLRNQRSQMERDLEQLNEEIAKATPRVVALAALVEDVPEDSDLGRFLTETAATGITDAVRTVLRSTPGLLRPVDVRNALIKMGVKLDYSNPLAVIGSTLKRLEESGEVLKTTTDSGTAFYGWSRPRDLPARKVPTLKDALKPSADPTTEEALKKFAEGRREQNFLKTLAKDSKGKK